MTRSARNASISSHPAFKWAVGLWFALLLGLGLFVMPDSVHASIADRLGLDGVVGTGPTARTALAGLAALIGLVMGLAVATRIAATGEARSLEDEFETDDSDVVWLEDETGAEAEPPAQPDETIPRKPLNPLEDIGEEGIVSAIESEVGPIEESGPGGSVAAEETTADDIELADWEECGEPWETPFGDAVAPDPSDGAPRASPLETFADDLTLDELTERLGAAIAASKRMRDAEPASPTGEKDAALAFLRREADRELPPRDRNAGERDSQAVLRDALDRLTRVGKTG